MQPTTFFSRKKLIEVGFLDESFFYAMDYELWCRFARNNAKFKYLQRVLAANRVYSETKTSSGGIKRLREIYRLQKRYKTGFWPHAFWGFTATEVYNKGLSSRNRLIEYIFKLFGSFISLLSPIAVFYSYKNQVRKQVRYGLYPHSSSCYGKVSIYLPFYNNNIYSAIKLEIGIDGRVPSGNQTVLAKVRLDGDDYIEIFLNSKCKRKKVTLSINEKTRKKNMIFVELSYVNIDSKVHGHLYGIKFVST
jgi:hypothetical protein